MRLIISIIIPLILSFGVCSIALNKTRRLSELALAASLTPMIAAAITSILLFFWILIIDSEQSLTKYLLVETIIFMVGIAASGFWWFKKGRGIFNNPKLSFPPFRWNDSFVLPFIGGAVFLLVFTKFIIEWIQLYSEAPLGEWDAWAIWNLRASFIASGDSWRAGFSPLISWSHPDYPLFLPISIAREWLFIGSRNPLIPSIFALMVLLSILSLLISGLWMARGWKSAVFAGLITLPMLFVNLRFRQYADMPLAFFFLATNYLLYLADTTHKNKPLVLILAGFVIGSAMWTKNEGIAMSITVAITEILRVWFGKILFLDLRKRWGYLLIGLAPMLLTVIVFKIALAPTNDLMANRHIQEVLSYLLDPSRYKLIVDGLIKNFFSLGAIRVAILPTLIFYTLIAGIEINPNDKLIINLTIFRLVILFSIYFGIYLITPYSLAWHIEFSMNRLILHLLPSAIFLVFLCTNGIETKSIHSSLRVET